MALLSIDVTATSDVSPYTLPAGFTNLADTWKVTSHSLRCTFSTEGISLAIATNPVTSGTLDVVWTTNHDHNVYGDNDGAVFVNPAGDGYVVYLNGDRLYLFNVVAHVPTTQIASSSTITYASGDTFHATYDLSTNVLNCYQVAVSAVVPAISGAALTPQTGMSNGIFVWWTNSGVAGFRTADLIVADASILLAATPQTVRTTTAVLTNQIQLAASSAAVRTATAALTNVIQLAATPQTVRTTTAALTNQIQLAASPAAVQTTTATLGVAIQLAATPQTVRTTTAALTNQIKLAASPSVVAAVSVDLSIAAINTIDAIVYVGEPFDATTEGLGTLTTASTVGGKAVAVANAPAGDGDLTPASFVDTATYPDFTTQEVALTDGIRVAKKNVTLAPPSTQSARKITSVGSGPGNMADYITYVIDDTFIFDLPATLSVVSNDVSASGYITSSFTGTQTMWHRADATGVMTQLTVITGIALAATPGSVVSDTGALTTIIKVAATPVSVTTDTAALTNAIRLATACADVVSDTAALTNQITIAANANVLNTDVAALTSSIKLAATPVVISTINAALTVPNITDFAANLLNQISDTAALTNGIKLSASISTSNSVNASLLSNAALVAAPAVNSTVSADLTNEIRVAAAASRVSSTSASLTTAIRLGANALTTPRVRAVIYGSKASTTLLHGVYLSAQPLAAVSLTSTSL